MEHPSIELTVEDSTVPSLEEMDYHEEEDATYANILNDIEKEDVDVGFEGEPEFDEDSMEVLSALGSCYISEKKEVVIEVPTDFCNMTVEGSCVYKGKLVRVLTDFGEIWIELNGHAKKVGGFPAGVVPVWNFFNSSPSAVRVSFFSGLLLPESWYQDYKMAYGHILLKRRPFANASRMELYLENGVTIDELMLCEMESYGPAPAAADKVLIDEVLNKGPKMEKIMEALDLVDPVISHIPAVTPAKVEITTVADLKWLKSHRGRAFGHLNLNEFHPIASSEIPSYFKLYRHLPDTVNGLAVILPPRYVLLEGKAPLAKFPVDVEPRPQTNPNVSLVVVPTNGYMTIGILKSAVCAGKFTAKAICKVEEPMLARTLASLSHVLRLFKTERCLWAKTFLPPRGKEQCALSSLSRKGFEHSHFVMAAYIGLQRRLATRLCFPRTTIKGLLAMGKKMEVAGNRCKFGRCETFGNVSKITKQAYALMLDACGVKGKFRLVRKKAYWPAAAPGSSTALISRVPISTFLEKPSFVSSSTSSTESPTWKNRKVVPKYPLKFKRLKYLVKVNQDLDISGIGSIIVYDDYTIDGISSLVNKDVPLPIAFLVYNEGLDLVVQTDVSVLSEREKRSSLEGTSMFPWDILPFFSLGGDVPPFRGNDNQ